MTVQSTLDTLPDIDIAKIEKYPFPSTFIERKLDGKPTILYTYHVLCNELLKTDYDVETVNTKINTKFKFNKHHNARKNINEFVDWIKLFVLGDFKRHKDIYKRRIFDFCHQYYGERFATLMVAETLQELEMDKLKERIDEKVDAIRSIHRHLNKKEIFDIFYIRFLYVQLVENGTLGNGYFLNDFFKEGKLAQYKKFFFSDHFSSDIPDASSYSYIAPALFYVRHAVIKCRALYSAAENVYLVRDGILFYEADCFLYPHRKKKLLYVNHQTLELNKNFNGHLEFKKYFKNTLGPVDFHAPIEKTLGYLESVILASINKPYLFTKLGIKKKYEGAYNRFLEEVSQCKDQRQVWRSFNELMKNLSDINAFMANVMAKEFCDQIKRDTRELSKTIQPIIKETYDIQKILSQLKNISLEDLLLKKLNGHCKTVAHEILAFHKEFHNHLREMIHSNEIVFFDSSSKTYPVFLTAYARVLYPNKKFHPFFAFTQFHDPKSGLVVGQEKTYFTDFFRKVYDFTANNSTFIPYVPRLWKSHVKNDAYELVNSLFLYSPE